MTIQNEVRQSAQSSTISNSNRSIKNRDFTDRGNPFTLKTILVYFLMYFEFSVHLSAWIVEFFDNMHPLVQLDE